VSIHNEDVEKRLLEEKNKWRLEELRNQVIFGWRFCYDLTGHLPPQSVVENYPELQALINNHHKNVIIHSKGDNHG